MTNKTIGNAFERDLCGLLAACGYWVHFIVPDARGAQPFDVIAVKDGVALAIDCKTCVANTFNISRLEENQILSFERWIACGNSMPIVAVQHAGTVYKIEYAELKQKTSIRLDREHEWKGVSGSEKTE